MTSCAFVTNTAFSYIATLTNKGGDGRTLSAFQPHPISSWRPLVPSSWTDRPLRERGGERSSGLDSDVFDHETKQWEHRKINVDHKPPGMRSGGHGKVIYSFGGREDTGLGRYNTLHKLDTEELRWIAFPPNIHSYAEAPMPKSGCEPVIIEDKLCLFGGFGTHTATGPLQPGSRMEQMW